MKRKTTKLIALAIGIFMLVLLLPTAAFAVVVPGDVCEIDGVGYTEFGDALAAVQDGEIKTIKLLDNVTYNEIINIRNRKIIILDLNGYVLDVIVSDNYGVRVRSYSSILLLDPTNGEFNVTGGGIDERSYNVQAVEVTSGSILEVSNVNTADYAAGAIVAWGTNSKVTVYGNVTSNTKDYSRTLDAGYGGEIIVYGDVTSTGLCHAGALVSRVNDFGRGGEITIEGKFTVPPDAVYIIIDEYLLIEKTQADGVPSITKPGYLEYTDGVNFVWVRIPDVKPDPCALGHTFSERIIIKNPTRTDKGEWEIYCEICDILLESGEIDELGIAAVTTDIDCFATIRETEKGSRIWEVTFTVTVTLTDEDGVVVGTDVVEYVIYLDGNNGNLSGSYTFDDGHDLAGYTLVYDIKGNGSNIKTFYIIKN